MDLTFIRDGSCDPSSLSSLRLDCSSQLRSTIKSPLPCSEIVALSDRGRALLLKRHSQTPAFKLPGFPIPGAASLLGGSRSSPSRISHGLSLFGHVVEGEYSPAHWLYVSDFHPSIVSSDALARDFCRAKLEAPAYPSAASCHSSAPSPNKVTGKRFKFTPFIVELFVAECFARTSSLEKSPTRLVAKFATPYASVVKRASQPPRESPRQDLHLL